MINRFQEVIIFSVYFKGSELVIIIMDLITTHLIARW